MVCILYGFMAELEAAYMAKTNVLNGNPFVYFLAVVFEMRNFAIHL